MTIENTDDSDEQYFENKYSIWGVEEKETFKSNPKAILAKYNNEDKKHLLFQKFLDVINETSFELKYLNSNNDPVEKSKFKLANLIKIEHIKSK